MATGIWPWRRGRRRSYSRGVKGALDLQMPPPYDMHPPNQRQDRERVEQLIASLAGGLDAGSREVLNNLINDLTDQSIARLRVERDERQAVSDILEGLARQEVARYRPRYEADMARVHQAGLALAVTFQDLTGLSMDEVTAPRPPRVQREPLVSTLGAVDVSDTQTRLAAGLEPGLAGGERGGTDARLP